MIRYIFSIGLFFCCIISTDYLLDSNLVIREFCAELLALFLIIFYLPKEKKVALTPTYTANILFAFFSFLSIFWSINKAEAIEEWNKIVIFSIIGVMVYNFLKNEHISFDQIITTVSVILTVSLLLGLWDILSINNYTLADLYNIKSIHAHKNSFTSFILLALPFVMTLLVTTKNRYYKIYGVILFVVSNLFVCFLQTRATWFGILISYFVYGLGLTHYLSLKMVKYIIGAVILILIVSAGVLIFVKINFYDYGYIKHNSDTERFLLWETSYYIIEKYLWVGTGIGNWKILFFDVINRPQIDTVDILNVTLHTPHNDFIWVLSETGLIGFSLYIFSIISVLFIGIKSFIITKNHKLLIFISFYIGFLANSFFDFPRERVEHSLLHGIIVAVILYFSGSKYYTFKSLKIVVLIPLILFFIFQSYYRYRGEYNVKKLRYYRDAKQHYNEIKCADKAFSVFYTIDIYSNPIMWYKGMAYYNLADGANALKSFKEALKSNPFNKFTLCNIGVLYGVLGDYPTSKHYLIKSLNASSSYADAKFNLASIYITTNKLDSAKYWIETIDSVKFPAKDSISPKKILYLNEIKNNY